jgi:hypothetical protein
LSIKKRLLKKIFEKISFFGGYSGTFPLPPALTPEQAHSFSGSLPGDFQAVAVRPHFKKIGTHPSVVSQPLK